MNSYIAPKGGRTLIGNQNTTARYQIISNAGEHRYRFFCGRSNMAVCTTRPIRADTPEMELQLAWESEGKQMFNRCHRCGEWVSDAMYNADTLECVVCSPWESQPDFCPKCGERVPSSDDFCRKCGTKLLYRGGENL